jgi:hypothetical protein
MQLEESVKWLVAAGPDHSRTVDETLRAKEDEKIIKQARNESTTARGDDGPPDPVVVTKREHCQSDRLNVSTTSNSQKLMLRLHEPCVPYPVIAVMMRGPRSRAGLMA